MVLLQCQLELSSSRPSQHSTLETCSVGGKQLHARHTVGRVLLAFPPFKYLFKLFCSLTAVFYYTRIFFPQFLRQGENLGGGVAGYIFWFGVDPYTSLAGCHTSMTSLDCKGLSSNHLYSCVQWSIHTDAIHAQRIHIYVWACSLLLMLKRQVFMSLFLSLPLKVWQLVRAAISAPYQKDWMWRGPTLRGQHFWVGQTSNGMWPRRLEFLLCVKPEPNTDHNNYLAYLVNE